MVLRSPALRMAAGALLLLTLLPSAQAQVPTAPPQSVLNFFLVCDQAYVQVDFLGVGDAVCTIEDLSRDSVQVPGTSGGTGATPHNVFVQATLVGNATDVAGWKATPELSVVSLYGGESRTFRVHVQTTPTLQRPSVPIDLTVNWTHPDGENLNQTARLVAIVVPYYQAFVETPGHDISRRADQNQRVPFHVTVRNDGVYPEYYHVNVRSNDPGFLVAQPAGVYVPPHETRDVVYTVLTPKGTFYEFGRSATFTAEVTSSNGARYTAVAILRVTGFYLPTYWIPMGLVALASGMVVVRRSREHAEMRRLEKGAPRRVQPTPRQAVLLAELKRADPEAYQARKAQLDALYAARRAEYKLVAKERRARDRAEAKEARAAFRAERKRRKREAKERRTLEARERKERKIVEAREAKERKAKEKELAKTRKILEKKRGKLEKKEAKAAKKQAKIDAKQAKADAKAAKKAEKAARKAAKKGGKL